MKKSAWDESKRISNLAKHGLDFTEADEVLQSRFRLAVLVVVAKEADEIRVIRFRHASEQEREVYYDWLENEHQDE